MKLWNKKNDKETRRLPMGRKSKRAFAAYAAVVLMACCFTTTAFAASDPSPSSTTFPILFSV